MLDGDLQMRHEQQIPSVEPLVVQRQVVDAEERCLGADAVRGVLGADELAQLGDHLHAGLLLAPLNHFLSCLLRALDHVTHGAVQLGHGLAEDARVKLGKRDL